MIKNLFLLQFDMPPTYYAFVYMVLDALLYGVLAWYLDAVLRGEICLNRFDDLL